MSYLMVNICFQSVSLVSMATTVLVSVVNVEMGCLVIHWMGAAQCRLAVRWDGRGQHVRPVSLLY